MDENINHIHLIARIQFLEQENALLKQVLKKNGIPFPNENVFDKPSAEGKSRSVCTMPRRGNDGCEETNDNPPSAKYRLSVQEKLDLFSSLFRGRMDVFARRWYSASTGKSGYQPVCHNEWSFGLCDKKQHKCAECPNREFEPLTSEQIYRHLEGKDELARDVIGLYSILEDNTCYFLCADFDDKNCEHGYQEDVRAYTSVCKDWGIHVSVERSRSGNGAHAWIFFEKPIPAYKARQLGNALLTEAMRRDGCISFKSYDRFFPNQDQLPVGGLGNLVALPLQGRARRAGNSLFVDDSFTPYKDQWEYLLSVRKMSEEHIDELIATQGQQPELGNLTKSSEKKPWELPQSEELSPSDFPSQIILIRANGLYIPIQGLSAKVLNHLKRIAAFRNPEFYSRQGMHFSTYNVPRIISCSEMIDDWLLMPRGCEDAVVDLLEDNEIPYHIDDKVQVGNPISVHFKGTLREDQEYGLKRLLEHNNGTLSATTAFGKTVTAAGLIAKRGVNTLILVHTKALLIQWKETLERFLDIDYSLDELTRKKQKTFSPIGCLCTGENSLHGVIDVALIQSCLSDGETKPFIKDYGMVIADECHHVSSAKFEQVMKNVQAKYVYGLTATPIRKDGHQPIIFMQCGPIRYKADALSQMLSQNFTRLLIPRFTQFNLLTDNKKSFTQIQEELSTNETRNLLILEDIVHSLQQGRTPLILTSRTSHVKLLAELLQPHCKHVVTLLGSESNKIKRQQTEKLKSIPTTESLAIIATGKYIGEGFDYPRLDTLFLTMPVSWKGLVAQYAGRLHRDYEGKVDVRIYDYVDIRVPLCELMYRRRLKGYSAVGYQVCSHSGKTSTTDSFFNGRNYLQPFLNDLLSAKHSIIIATPKIIASKTSKVLQTLVELMRSGIEVAITTQDVSTEIVEHLPLTLAPIQPCNFVVIDRTLIWYGDIHFLGYSTESSTAIRLDDSALAEELLQLYSSTRKAYI